MRDERRSGEVVCFGIRTRPHVLARVRLEATASNPDLDIPTGVRWRISESTGGFCLHLSCRHGEGEVDLADLYRQIRSSPRRVRIKING